MRFPFGRNRVTLWPIREVVDTDMPGRSAETFTEVQVLADLIALLRRTPDPVFAALLARVPGAGEAAALRALIAASGRRLHAGPHLDMQDALLWAATSPGRDRAGFLAATALLLADRLQGGSGADDLFWHFDAHADHYRAAPPGVRAVLMRGFALSHALGQVTLAHPPGPGDLVSVPRAQVLAGLAGVPGPLPPALTGAGEGEGEGEGGGDGAADWAATAPAVLALPAARRAPILAGYRHLFETRPGWDPWPGLPPHQLAATAIVIPLPEA